MKTKKKLSLEQFEQKTVKSEMFKKINGGASALQQYCHPGHKKLSLPTLSPGPFFPVPTDITIL